MGVVCGSCAIGQPKIASEAISITSQFGSSVQVRVFLEGSDGNEVTGARASATSPGGSVQTLGFNLQEGCYFGSFPESLSGTYKVNILSTLLGEQAKEVGVKHTVLDEAPSVTQCVDSDGHNGLLGQSLVASEAVDIHWNPVGNATVYTIAVNQGAIQKWSTTTSDPLVSVPAGVLSAGNYTLQVNAQWIQGDPYLQTSTTYSASQSIGSSVLMVLQ